MDFHSLQFLLVFFFWKPKLPSVLRRNGRFKVAVGREVMEGPAAQNVR